MAIVQSQYTLINLQWETQLWGGLEYWVADSFFMGHPLENRFIYFNHHQQKPVTRGKPRILCISWGSLPGYTLGCLFSVSESRWTVYTCIYSSNNSAITQGVKLWDLSAHLPWWCACPPATARCRIRTTQIYQGLFLVPFFPGLLCILFITISPPPNKTKHVCRSSNTLCISLYHFHIPHFQVFPSLGRKVTCVFSVKHPCYRSHNHGAALAPL